MSHDAISKSRGSLPHPNAAAGPGRAALVGCALLTGLFQAGFSWSAHAAPMPYGPDPGTVYLFHLNEPAGGSVVTNSAPKTAGTNLVSFSGNPFAGDGIDQPVITTLLGAAGSGLFGKCADLSGATVVGLGLDVNGSGGFQLDDGAPASGDRIARHHFFGPGNTFTLEALVSLPSITSGSREIISTDHGSANDARGLQFRVTSAGQLEFNFIGVSTTAALATIPTNGAHAFVPGAWFHVAVAYDGGNARFYWTRLDSGAMGANLIGGPVAEGVDALDSMLLVLGNEGRAVGSTGSTEGLAGLIDEVRLSNVARATNEFLFTSTSVLEFTANTQLENPAVHTLDGNLATRWSAQGDGQHITYDLGRIANVSQVSLAFYQPGTVRTNWFDVLLSNDNLVWRPALTNASGTNTALAAFDFPDWPARYIRYVGHMNSQNDFNSLTEIEIMADYATDSDSDGLSDLWETHYFTHLAAPTYGDPDGDGQSNEYEFMHGTDPTVFTDGGDIDGDSLSDGWEMSNLGSLNYGAYDDPDGDGYSNQAEQLAGTLPLDDASVPSWAPPGVAFLRNSVAATNACLMPGGSTYGRAINGISFQKDNIVLTFDGYQYTAWYDTVGTSQFVRLARRAVTNTSVGAWETFQTDSEFLNGDETSWDAHNVIAIGICPADGTLHLSWDHHNNTLRYRRSVVGLCTTNKAAWGPGMLNTEQNWLAGPGQAVSDVTYPQFTLTPSGGLVLNHRIGSSGNGDQLFYNYLPISGSSGGNWGGPTLFLSRTGTYNGSTSRCAYINGFDFGPDGKIHVSWTWREGAGTSNHDICYAYSTNHGVSWLNNAGTVIADTRLGQSIHLNSPGIVIKPLDLNQLLINQQAQCVDNGGRVHVLMLHRREEPGYEYPNYTTAAYSTLATAYHHYFRDPMLGGWTQRRLPVDAWPVGSRPKLGFDADGNLYAVFLSYPAGTAVYPGYASGKLVVASASQASQYTDWKVAQALDITFNGEPLLDQSRLLADGILSVYIQEHSATTLVAGTPLHLFDFAVRVASPEPLAMQFFGPDVLVTLAATNAAAYQLQATPGLSPAGWVDAGPAVPGVNGLLSLPDPNGRAVDQRFYRVIENP